MDPSFIKPFIASIKNVFSTMLQLPVTIGDPRIKSDASNSFDVSGIIGMSGDVMGTVVLSFPSDSAERMVTLFCGQKLDANTPDFADAVGELVNMVSGGAKAMFAGKRVSISCPSVVVGKHHHIARQSDIPTICVPCSTDCGELVIELSIRDNTSANATSKAASANA